MLEWTNIKHVVDWCRGLYRCVVILRLLQYGGEIKASSDTNRVQYTLKGQKEKNKMLWVQAGTDKCYSF